MPNNKLEQQYLTSAINTKVLNYGVYVMKPGEKLLYSLGLFVIGGIVGLIFYGGLFKSEGEATLATHISNIVIFLLIGLLARFSFLPIVKDSLRRRRLNTLKTQFRDFLYALSNAVSGGMNVNDAFNSTYRDVVAQFSKDSPIAVEVKEILDCVNNGVQLEDALLAFGKRSSISDITNFAIVFSTCYRSGGNIKSVIRRSTEIISEKMTISEEIETSITSNKLQMLVMNVLPIFLIFAMRIMSRQFSESFGTIVGVISLTVAAAMFFAAYKIGQKIMNIEG